MWLVNNKDANLHPQMKAIKALIRSQAGAAKGKNNNYQSESRSKESSEEDHQDPQEGCP